MTPLRFILALLMLIAVATQLTSAIPTGGTEEKPGEAEEATPEGHKTKEQLLEEYVHQTKEGDCHPGHCDACKSEDSCVGTGACMWCVSPRVPLQPACSVSQPQAPTGSQTRSVLL